MTPASELQEHRPSQLTVTIPASHGRRHRHNSQRKTSSNAITLHSSTSSAALPTVIADARRHSSPGFMKGLFSGFPLLSSHSADPFDDIGLGFHRDYTFVPKSIQVEIHRRNQHTDDTALESWDELFRDCTLRSMPEYDARLKNMIRSGVPENYRPLVWFYYSGAFNAWQKNDGSYAWLTFREELDNHCGYTKDTNKILEMISSIDRDIYRTFPDNDCFKPDQGQPPSTGYNMMIPFSFSRKGSSGTKTPKSRSRQSSASVETLTASDPSEQDLSYDGAQKDQLNQSRPISRERNPFLLSLRRILVAFAYYSYPHPDERMDVKRVLGHSLNYKIGYCQSLNFIAGLILLVFGSEPHAMESNSAQIETEEKVFWMLVTIVQDKLPKEMFGEKLEGVSIMQEIFWKEMVMENGHKYGLTSLAEWLLSRQIVDDEEDEEGGYKPINPHGADSDDTADGESSDSSIDNTSSITAILRKKKIELQRKREELRELEVVTSTALSKSKKMLIQRKLVQKKALLIKSKIRNMRTIPPLTIVTTPWFLTLFINHLPISTVLRIWDTFVCQGERFLYRVALTFLKIHEEQLVRISDPTLAWKYIKEMGHYAVDSRSFIQSCFRPYSANYNKELRTRSASESSRSVGRSSRSLSPIRDTEESHRDSSVSASETSKGNCATLQDEHEDSSILFIIGSSLSDGVPGVGHIASKVVDQYREKIEEERRLRQEILQEGLVCRDDIRIGDYSYISDGVANDGDVDSDSTFYSESAVDI